MRRTAQRPLPAGRMKAATALRFGLGLSIAGTVYLWLLVSPLTTLLAVAAFIVAGLAVWTAWRGLTSYKEPALRLSAMALAALVMLQLGLGMAAYMGRLAAGEAVQPLPWVVGITVTHVATGALAFAASVTLTLQAHRLIENKLIQNKGRLAAWIPATGKTHS